MRYAATIIQTKSCGRKYFRLVLAHWNRAATDMHTGEKIQSFAAKYRIKERGDFVEYDEANAHREIFEQSLSFLKISPEEIHWIF